jgi:hypothetical protein
MLNGLREAKVLTTCRDSRVESFPEILIAVILRQIKLIEAGVTARQTILVAVVAVNVESTKAVHALQLFEAIEWHLRCASDKLEKLCSLFLVERANSAPEPLNLRRRGGVVVVLGVVAPVLDVDIWQARDEKFEFLLVEDRD